MICDQLCTVCNDASDMSRTPEQLQHPAVCPLPPTLLFLSLMTLQISAVISSALSAMTHVTRAAPHRSCSTLPDFGEFNAAVVEKNA